jgi:4-amino-4-deoxy-L-arabinose transferase-like glycosyltransferase
MSNTKTSSASYKAFSNLLAGAAGHPYITAFILCLSSAMVFLGAADYMATYVPVIFYALFCGVSALIVSHFCVINKVNAAVTALLTSAVCAGGTPFFVWFNRTHNRILFVFAFCCILMSALYFAFYGKKLAHRFNAMFIMGLSFVVKLCYVLGTSVYDRQHDIGWFGGSEEINSGHMGYISYLFYHHRLYDGDYRGIFQYCHPPLHHSICALWIGFFNKVLGVDLDRVAESAQMLSLFWSMTIVITAYKIFRYFKLEGTSLYVPLIITAFHPCFTFLAGLMNNDPLSWALTLGAVYFTLRWYRESTLKNILKLALCIGLGMMTKLSVGLIAPSVTIVFIAVLVKSRKGAFARLLGQFAAFAAVCAPLGLWFPLRARIRWGIPFTYVQELPEMDQTIKGTNFMERITDFSAYQFSRVFENWLWYDGNGDPQSYNEHNPLIAIMKNSVFGEFITEGNFTRYPFMLNVCKWLFWLGAFIAAAAFIAMIVSLFRKCAADGVQKIFLVSFHLILVGNLYMLSKKYPMVCSMNFRYIMPTVIIGAFFLGASLTRADKQGSTAAKVLKLSSYAAVLAFAVMSSLVYLMVVIDR